MKNSNEKRPPHTPKTEDGIGARDPHTLYNKFSTNGIDSGIKYKNISEAFTAMMDKYHVKHIPIGEWISPKETELHKMLKKVFD